MQYRDQLARLSRQMEAELTERLLPFWAERTLDEQHGGFIGKMDARGQVVAEAPKALVLNARILWTFAAAAQRFGEERYAQRACRAYQYLMEHFWDDQYGGFFWMLRHDAALEDPRKQVYAQAFGIYALAEYYALRGEQKIMRYALCLFDLLEEHVRDDEHGGYFETYNRDWTPVGKMRLSERDPAEKRSMNTHLHVMEAYTALLRVHHDGEVKEKLSALVERFLSVILNPDTGHLRTFFSEDWSVRSDEISFGHDIEVSWLLTEAATVLQDEALFEEVKAVSIQLAEATLRDGLDAEHGVVEEGKPQAITDDDRHGWPQAEAVIGFVNAFELTGEVRFLEAAQNSWDFIERYMLDREHGEWALRVSSSGEPYPGDDKVGPWKAPYHSVRACLEVMDRAGAARAAASGVEETLEAETMR